LDFTYFGFAKPEDIGIFTYINCEALLTKQVDMIELRRPKSRISISPTVWTMTLELARLCGWEPQGTCRIELADGAEQDALRDIRHMLPWQIEYIASDGQTITREDATHLAEAFVRAALDGDRILAQWNTGQIQPTAVLRTPCTGFRWFNTSDGRHHLQAVADFCRKGEFQIF
jgi:hypothetical protein